MARTQPQGEREREAALEEIYARNYRRQGIAVKSQVAFKALRYSQHLNLAWLDQNFQYIGWWCDKYPESSSDVAKGSQCISLLPLLLALSLSLSLSLSISLSISISFSLSLSFSLPLSLPLYSLANCTVPLHPLTGVKTMMLALNQNRVRGR